MTSTEQADPMVITKVAKRYALALYDEALEQSALESVAKDMSRIRDIINDSNDLRLFLKSLIISRDIKNKIITELFGSRYTDLTTDFIRLLLNKRREVYLEEIISAFQELYKKQKGILDVEVMAAKKPDKSQLDLLMSALKKKTSKEIRLSISEDPDLKGGMAVKIQDTIIDGTIKNKLQQLETTFQKTSF